MKPGISAVVIAYNQTDLLKKCLASIHQLADEIIVLDLESTEDVQGVAKTYQAEYIKHKKVTIVEEIRQSSLQYAHHEYVLFIDPDETISTELADKLKTMITQTHPDFVKMPRQNYIFGKWIEHSLWWPDYQVRLFKKDAISWPKELHAQPLLSGEGVTLEPKAEHAIIHQNYRNLDEWMDKNKRYAHANAAELRQLGSQLTLLEAMQKSVGEIIRRFFQAEGYKDGMHGLVLSVLQSFYYFLVYAYYWEGEGYIDLETKQDIHDFPGNWYSHGLAETLYWEPKKNVMKQLKTKLVRKLIA